jgi:hypothetical protein
MVALPAFFMAEPGWFAFFVRFCVIMLLVISGKAFI